MPPVESLSDRMFCERVCRVASEHGWLVRKSTTQLFGTSYTWLSPEGEQIATNLLRCPERSLLNACRELLPHVYDHI